MKKRLPEISSSAFRALILGYLQRCGSPIPLDRDAAIKAGALAVQALSEGLFNGVSTITRTPTGIEPTLLSLEQVLKRDASGHVIRRSLDLRFYDAERYQMSPAGTGYFRPLFGDLPRPNLSLDDRLIEISKIG